jgi:hypothetical protein
LDLKELKKLIAQGEGLRTDFKLDMTPQSAQDFGKDLSALANTEGGHIIVGVGNKRNVVGVNWNGVKSSMVVQQGQNCVPPVTVTVHEVRYPKKGIVVAIEVLKSPWIHMDPNKRFPHRLGDHTSFMDAYDLIALARERGILGSEPTVLGAPYPVVAAYAPQPRQAATKLRFLVGDLSDTELSRREEALKDLNANSYQFAIENLDSLEDKLTTLLDDEAGQVRLLAMQLLYSIIPHLSLRRKANLDQTLVPKLEDLSLHDKEPDVRNLAILLLCILGSRKVVSVIVGLVKSEPEATYPQLGLSSGFVQLSESGMGCELRQRLSEALSGDLQPEIRGRILKLLNSLRSVRWAT